MKIVRDTMVMLVSNLLIISLSIIQYPILLRFYNFPAEVFGVFQYLISIVSAIAAFSYLSLNGALIAERKEHTCSENGQFFSWFLILSNLLAFLILTIISLGRKEFGTFFIMGGCVFISQSFYNVFYTLARDKKQFIEIAIAACLLSVFKIILVVLLGYFIRNATTLVLSFAIANVFAGLILWTKVKTVPKVPNLKFISTFIKQNRQIVGFQTASNVINTLSFNLPVFLVEMLFVDLILGFYSLAYRTLLTANRLFSQVIAQTILPYMSKSSEDEKNILAKFHYLPMLLFPMYFLMCSLSDYYVPFIFGPDNIEIAVIIRILAPWMFATAVCSPITASYIVHKRNLELLILNIILLLARAFTLLVFPDSGYTLPFLLFTVVSVFFFIIFLVRSYQFAKANFKKVLLLIVAMEIVLFLVLLDKRFLPFGYALSAISLIFSFRKGVAILRGLKWTAFRSSDSNIVFDDDN